MNRFWMMSVGFVLSVSGAGCLSAVDDGCVSDDECRAGRICDDGRCRNVGAAPGNSAAMNHGATNGDPDNAVDPMSECSLEQECAGPDQVCSGTTGALTCVEPLQCVYGEGEETEDGCVVGWVCDISLAYGVTCTFVPGVGITSCTCETFDLETGEATEVVGEFATEQFLCGEDPAVLTRLANTNCGWRLPLTFF